MRELSNELYHYGVHGMKWGVRRYQNKDGTLTPHGKKRIAKEASEYYKSEAEKRLLSGKARMAQIDKTLNSNKNLSLDETDRLFREWDAIDSSWRHLKSRSEEIKKNSKVGKRYVSEYKNNVPVNKLLKAYSQEYAYYQYNFMGDKEWLLNWNEKTGPKFD